MSAREYERLGKIGSGTYSIVYKCRSYETGALVAVKRERGLQPSALRELSILRTLNHSNVVKLHSFTIQGEILYQVLELCDQDLDAWIKARKEGEIKELRQLLDQDPETWSKGSGEERRVEAEVRPLLQQILTGLDYCHACSVMHRDLKPGNILLTNGKVKLADFGLSRFCTFPVRGYTASVQTLCYRAPELLFRSSEAADYGPAIDMWSVGVIFYEMMTGKALFQGMTAPEVTTNVLRVLGSPTESDLAFLEPDVPLPLAKGKEARINLDGWSDEARDLLMRMLKYNPAERIDTAEALCHPFFDP